MPWSLNSNFPGFDLMAPVGTLLVAQQFALKQIRRHRRAVNLHKGAAGICRHLMDIVRQDLLACAALTEYENRHICGGHHLAMGSDGSHLSLQTTNVVFAVRGIS